MLHSLTADKTPVGELSELTLIFLSNSAILAASYGRRGGTIRMDVTAQFEKAIQHKLVGEYDAAIAVLRPLLQAQPNNAEVYHELGLIHSFKVDMDESLYYLEMAVRLAPQSIAYMLDAGKTHAMFGNDDKAKAIFEYILKLEPGNDEAKKNLAYYQ